MEDAEIIARFLKRDASALEAVIAKYSNYCCSIAYRILGNAADAEECVNDTWLHAWNAIPPHRPERLALFLGKMTRELAINRCKAGHAQKRGSGEYALTLDEIAEIIPDRRAAPEDAISCAQLGNAISDFLRSQPRKAASIFIRRYYHLCSIQEIAQDFGFSESKVKSILFRMRKKLYSYLEKGDYL